MWKRQKNPQDYKYAVRLKVAQYVEHLPPKKPWVQIAESHNNVARKMSKWNSKTKIKVTKEVKAFLQISAELRKHIIENIGDKFSPLPAWEMFLIFSRPQV
jgi:hypothetical protein